MTTVTISTYHFSDETVDENGFHSGQLLTFQGSKIPDDLHIHKSSRQYKDFEECFHPYYAEKQRVRAKAKE